MDPRDETRRLLAHLKAWIVASGRSQRSIERRAGLSRGYLSQILAGRVELKYRQLLGVLAAMELDPGDFFPEVFRRPLPPPAVRGGLPALDPDLTRVFGLGLDAVEELRRRLARCEEALAGRPGTD